MAQKRRIEVRTSQPQETGSGSKQVKDQSLGEWARRDYARYWFWVISIAVDGFVGMYLATASGGIALPVVSLFLVAAVGLEYYLYRRLWHKRTNEE